MMKRCKFVFADWLVLVLVVCLMMPGLVETAYSQTDESTMLLIQKTPPEGGNVTPRDGIHDVSLGIPAHKFTDDCASFLVALRAEIRVKPASTMDI